MAEKRIIRPLSEGRPRLGLSKKPGLTLIAKPSKPGIQAVFTSTSPFTAGSAIERIGGMTTPPGVQGGEGAFGDVDGGEVERDGAAEVGLGDEEDVMRHRRRLRG